MGLCKHFQQGYCRFGSKCNFDHIDIKQLVKNDMESAINGKQFPFSCYGPFKDKPCVPNFIEDQSFEEVRLLCYEARQKNCFDQFHQQFMVGVSEATNKLKALIQPTYEVMNILAMIYDAPAKTSSNNNGTSNVGNSIFGKTAVPVISTVGNVFGGSTSIFAAGAKNSIQPAGGIFGGQNRFESQSSHFGQQTQQQQSQQTANVESLFGSAGKPTLLNSGVGNFGIFDHAGQQAAPMYQQNLSRQQQTLNQMQSSQSTGMFGQNVFNMQKAAFSAPQSHAQTQNIFGQSGQMEQSMSEQPNAMTTNIFAQCIQQNNGGPSQGFFEQTDSVTDTKNAQKPQAQDPTRIQINQNSQAAFHSGNDDFEYSKINDLTAAEIEAFKADFFEPGKVPFFPPALELLN